MANTILITANWHTGALSQQTISRQYDNNRYVVQFVGYPEASEGNELDYYLLVWMSSAPGERPDEIAPIQLASDQWYISNVFTQQTQQIKFQMCALNTEGTFEAHSPIFTGFVRNSLEHDGTTQDIDVSTLFDAYREYLNELIIRSGAVVIDSVPTQGSINAVSSGGVWDSLDEISEDYGTIGEDVITPITLDLSDVNAGYRCGDNVGNSNGLIASSVTTCIRNAFTCEAGKEYILTITNGQTPARIAERGTVVVIVNNKVAWAQKSTNTAEAEDIVEFTPEVSGSVWFNLDLNYTNVAVVTIEEQAASEKTAVDKTARADIETLQNTLAGVPEAVTLAQEEIDTLTEEVEQLSSTTASVTETSIDGTVDNPVDVDLNDIHIGAYCNGSIGQSVGYNTSTATTCIAKAFECEAGKTYKITVTNSNTPASLAQRAIVIYGANDKVVWYTYYRTTANLKDVITFTPTESGFAYINVDKNYTAVSATVEAENVVITAVDAVARKGTKFILNGTVAKDVVFEEGAFDATLADTVGTGYRSNVVTGVEGCVVCIKVNPSYAFTYGDGVNALMSIYGIYVIHCISDTIRIGLSDTPENVGFEMRIYRERGHKGKYDVIVSASDSSDDDKAKADIICDGVNDELDLQFAVNWNYGRQERNQYQDFCNVLLMPGTYNIDNFTQQYTADGRIMRSKNAVVMGNHSAILSSSYSYRPTISGCYETEHGFYDSNVLINVTTSGINALDAELDNVIFGIPLDTNSETGAIRMNNISVGVYNLCIFTNGIDNKIICIDGYQAGNTVVKNCDIWSTKSASGVSASMIAAIPEGSIGIRAGRGSDLGVRQRIEGCRIHGYHEGIAICGEHFICEGNLEIRCYYGFTINNYPSGGALQHPNVFIGNSIEQCYKMGKLGVGNNKTTLVYIGGSVEHAITNGSDEPVYMLPIDCLSDLKNRGRIESDGLGGEYANSFFYEGYGTNFVQTIYPYKQI